MKPAIPITAAFVVGLAGAAFMAKGSAAPPAGDEPPAPVTAPHPAAADTTQHPGDSVTIKQPIAPDSVAASAPGSAAAAPDPDTTHPPPIPGGTSTERLATVLGKLAPTDIVPIAEFIKDEDFGPVLRRLDLTTSAAVLALLPPARAKTLSKQLLLPTGTAKP